MSHQTKTFVESHINNKSHQKNERFFSFCKYTDTDQRYSMSDNARREAFMAHYNGDVEGWLD